jgi:hypothetical protein
MPRDFCDDFYYINPCKTDITLWLRWQEYRKLIKPDEQLISICKNAICKYFKND